MAVLGCPIDVPCGRHPLTWAMQRVRSSGLGWALATC